MTNRPQDWIVAASCCEGPRPCVTFADMPLAHRRDMAGIAFAAALSTAYFVTLAILLQPIQSRSLAGQVPMPQPVVASAAVPVASPEIPLDGPSRRPRHRAVRPLAAIQLASSTERLSVDRASASAAVPQERRRGFFGRFLRGVLRTPRPKAAVDEP